MTEQQNPVFEFDRYRNGRRMAEGVRISKAKTEEEARRIALTLYRDAADMGELRLRHSDAEVCAVCGGTKPWRRVDWEGTPIEDQVTKASDPDGVLTVEAE